jgi:hypothetical protein
MGKRLWPVNLCCLGATLLIAASFFASLWRLTARAVQYETEFPEGLKVYAYLWKFEGEIYEFNIMNEWIGARFPEQPIEHVIFPVLFGGLALFCLAAILLNHWKRRALQLALILAFLLALAGAASLQGRLYAFGHLRDPYPPILVPDFTVPLLGSTKLWNWTITTAPDVGAYTLGLAALLVALAYVISARTRKEKAP